MFASSVAIGYDKKLCLFGDRDSCENDIMAYLAVDPSVCLRFDIEILSPRRCKKERVKRERVSKSNKVETIHVTYSSTE